MRTNAERLELAIRERRLTWTRKGSLPRSIRLHVLADRPVCPDLHPMSRLLTSSERRALTTLPVRFMRRRDDAPGVSRGIVLMAE